MLLLTSEECLHMRINRDLCISIIISRKGRRLLVKMKIPRAVSTSHCRDLNMVRGNECWHRLVVIAQMYCSWRVVTMATMPVPLHVQCFSPVAHLSVNYNKAWIVAPKIYSPFHYSECVSEHSGDTVCEKSPHTTDVWPELGIRTVGCV